MAYPSIYLKNFQTSPSPIVHCSKFSNEGGKGGGEFKPCRRRHKIQFSFCTSFYTDYVLTLSLQWVLDLINWCLSRQMVPTA